MFTDDYLQYDASTLAFVTKDEAQSTYAKKTDIPTLAGGLDLTLADSRYAPKTGSTVYATKAEIPDVTGKADTTDVVNALTGKADASHTHSQYAPQSTTYTKTEVDTALAGKASSTHTHTGVYQPVGSYLVAADIAGKADTTDVVNALAGKADATHNHNGTYAPATGSTVYATKTEVTEATGGGLTQTAGDARYVQQANLFVGVTDITDQLYPAKQVTYSKTEVDDAIGSVYANVYTITDTDTLLGNKANTTDVTTALAGKADATHTHSGVYQPVGSYLVAADIAGKANTTDVTTALAGKADASHTHSQYASQATTYTKTEVDTALAGKATTTHNHDGTYAPVSTTYTKTEVDSLLTGLGGGPQILVASGSWGITSAWEAIRGWTVSTNTSSLSEQMWGVWYYPAGQPTKTVHVVLYYQFSANSNTGQRRVVLNTNSTFTYTVGASPPNPDASGAVIHSEYREEQPGATGSFPVAMTISAIFRMQAGSWFNVWNMSPTGSVSGKLMITLS